MVDEAAYVEDERHHIAAALLAVVLVCVCVCVCVCVAVRVCVLLCAVCAFF